MNIQIVRHDVVGSTNDEAMGHARMGAQEGLCVVASRQTKGRGREGREWSSEEGAGLYLSIVFRPNLEPQQLPVLTLLCAIAVHDMVRDMTGVSPDIKWPNDILVEEKKLCGILLETCETSQGTAVVAGIGLNLDNSLMPDGIRVISTSINAISEKEHSFTDCLAALTRSITTRYMAFESTKSVTDILGDWSARSSYANGKKVAVSMRNTSFYGETMGLDSSGSLIVRRKDTGQIVAVTAGDVTSVREDIRTESEQTENADQFAEDVNSDQLCDDEGVLNIEKVQ